MKASAARPLVVRAKRQTTPTYRMVLLKTGPHSINYSKSISCWGNQRPLRNLKLAISLHCPTEISWPGDAASEWPSSGRLISSSAATACNRGARLITPPLQEQRLSGIGELDLLGNKSFPDLQVDFLLDRHVEIVVRSQHVIHGFEIQGEIPVLGEM